jgi:hypothetical protein
VASAKYASGCESDDHKSLPLVLPAPGTKCTDKWNLKTVIMQFDKEEKEFDKGFQVAVEAYHNASWRTPFKSPKKCFKKPSKASEDTSKQKKTRFVAEFLTLKGPNNKCPSAEEKEKKPAAVDDCGEKDEVEDSVENNPKFSIIKHSHHSDPQLTLTQYWRSFSLFCMLSKKAVRRHH